MSYADDLEELIRDEPPAVQKALRAALSVLEHDDGPPPEEAIKTLAKIGLSAAKGAVPTAGAIIDGIVALITLGRTIREKRLIKVAKSRKAGTAAGLAAYHSNKMASDKSRAQAAEAASKGAAEAWVKARSHDKSRGQ